MSRAVHLDYQRTPGGFPWAGMALLALTLALLARIGSDYVSLTRQAAKLEAKAVQIAQTHPKLRNEKLSVAEVRDRAQEVKRANEVLRRLTLPWERLFQAVESSSGKEVALLTVNPDMEKGVVKISGEAKNLASALEYIQKLEKQEMFGTVYLQSHQIQWQDSEKPVRFSILGMLRRKS
jgi:uncharacterized protein YfaT (DUF1175 family)